MSNDDHDTPRPPIQYEQMPAGGGMTRRQGRWLILLMLVNTVLLAVGVAGPQIGPAVRKQIDDWLARRAAAKAEEQKAASRAQKRQLLLVNQERWLTHNFAPNTIVYEEDPKLAAAHLISGKGYRAIKPQNMPALSPPWQPPVITPVPSPVNQLSGIAYSSDEGVVFLHERRTPAGARKLVCVAFNPSQRAIDVPAASLDQRVITEMTLRAHAFEPLRSDSGSGGKDSLDLWKTQSLTLIVPQDVGALIDFTGNSRPGAHEIRPGAYLRLLAGTPNPDDASHFTIPYQLGEMSGTIDGWLREDAIELRGREGGMGPQSTWLLPVPKP